MNSDNEMMEIILRYILLHKNNDIKNKIDSLLKEAFELEEIDDLGSIRSLEIDTVETNNGMFLSRLNLTLYNTNYSNVTQFEGYLNDEDDIKTAVKVYDSYKLEENQRFLVELYNMEMKIREIFSVIMYLQNVKFEWSKATVKKDFKTNPEAHRKKMMNEFFFIEFSDYKNVGDKKDIKFTDLLEILKSIDNINDLLPQIQDLIQPTLGLKERFEEISRIPKAIGRLESFRNAIAHNRYLSLKDIENFEKAKGIIQEVYNVYVEKFKNKEL